MERIHTQNLLKMAAIFLGAAAFAAVMPHADAATVFAKPEAEAPLAPGETYAASQFGRKPGFAARETSEMEVAQQTNGEGDSSGGANSGAGDSTSGASRAPAGLVFKQDHVTDDTAVEKGPGVRIDQMGRGPEARAGRVVVRFESQEARAAKPDADSLEPASAIARKGVQEVALIASDLGFFPKTVFVNRDIPVRLFVTGASKNTLCLMMDSFQVRKQVRSQKIEEITFTPNLPGKYRFYCPVGGMEGSLVVRELGGTAVAGVVDGRSPANDGRSPANDGRSPATEASANIPNELHADRAPASVAAPIRGESSIARPGVAPEGVREE